MKFQRPIIASLSIAAISAIIIVIGGHFAATRLIETQQAMQLRELGDVALRRAEMAVDFGAATLDELANRGSISCDASALQAVRLHVYQRGWVWTVSRGIICVHHLADARPNTAQWAPIRHLDLATSRLESCKTL